MNQLKAGIVLNYIIIVLNLVVGLLYTPYMLRMLGQSEYGVYSLVASIIAYLTVLDFGLGNAIVRYTAKYRAEGKTQEQYAMFGMFFILYAVIGLLSLLAGFVLYNNVNNMFGDTMSATELDQVRIMMLILVFNLAFTFPLSLFPSIITAYERFVFPKFINVIRIILNTLVMILLLSVGYKAVAMVVIQTIFNIITLVINYIYCKKNLKIKIHFVKFKLSFLKEVSVYSFWIFLNFIMDKVYWSTGQFILGAVSGAVAISVFALAIQLQAMYMAFSGSIANVFLPKVTSMVALRNNREEISDLFIRTGRVQNIVMVLILFGFMLFGKPFITLWAGPEYVEAYYITVLFFVALYVPLIQNLGVTILQARNNMKFRSVLYVVIAVIAFILQYFLAKIYGALGCAIAISGALLLGQGLIMNVYYRVCQGISIGEFWAQICKMNIVPVILSLCFYVIFDIESISRWTDLLGYIAVYLTLYLPLFCAFGMNGYERELILRPIKKLIMK